MGANTEKQTRAVIHRRARRHMRRHTDTDTDADTLTQIHKHTQTHGHRRRRRRRRRRKANLPALQQLHGGVLRFRRLAVRATRSPPGPSVAPCPQNALGWTSATMKVRAASAQTACQASLRRAWRAMGRGHRVVRSVRARTTTTPRPAAYLRGPRHSLSAWTTGTRAYYRHAARAPSCSPQFVMLIATYAARIPSPQFVMLIATRFPVSARGWSAQGARQGQHCAPRLARWVAGGRRSLPSAGRVRR